MEYIRIITCKPMTTDEIWVRILIYNDCGTEKFLNVFFPVILDDLFCNVIMNNMTYSSIYLNLTTAHILHYRNPEECQNNLIDNGQILTSGFRSGQNIKKPHSRSHHIKQTQDINALTIIMVYIPENKGFNLLSKKQYILLDS